MKVVRSARPEQEELRPVYKKGFPAKKSMRAEVSRLLLGDTSNSIARLLRVLFVSACRPPTHTTATSWTNRPA
jgi:hypothetical protein